MKLDAARLVIPLVGMGAAPPGDGISTTSPLRRNCRQTARPSCPFTVSTRASAANANSSPMYGGGRLRCTRRFTTLISGASLGLIDLPAHRQIFHGTTAFSFSSGSPPCSTARAASKNLTGSAAQFTREAAFQLSRSSLYSSAQRLRSCVRCVNLPGWRTSSTSLPFSSLSTMCRRLGR